MRFVMAAVVAVAVAAAGCAGDPFNSSESPTPTTLQPTLEPAASIPADRNTVATSLVIAVSVVPSTTPLPPASSDPAVVVAPAVDVVVTGLLGRNPDGTAELCPWESDCLGVRIAGDVDTALDGLWVEAEGSFDGHWLVPSRPPRELVAQPVFAQPPSEPFCPDLPPLLPPGPDVTEAAQRYTDSVPDLFAGVWIDETNVMTFFFVGDDVDAHRVALGQATNDFPLCVIGGARWSLADLENVAETIRETSMSELGMFVPSGAGGVDNIVGVSVRLLDDELRQWLARFGEQVRVWSYIELVAAPRNDFPAIAPIAPGDVPIATQRDGGRNGEEAGVGFTLLYDEQRSCVFGESVREDGVTSRVLPVWPDGYTATADPLTVYDFDGIPVAVEGEKYRGGGGSHDPAMIDRYSDQSDTCGVEGPGNLVVITR